jgi:hypothetical protein
VLATVSGEDEDGIECNHPSHPTWPNLDF